MKKFFGIILTAILTIVLCAVPDTALAAENQDTDDEFFYRTEGTLVEVKDCGDGTVISSYVVEAPTGGIQPYAAATRTAYKYTDIAIEGAYSFTIKQTATFTYGRPDGVVTISNATTVVHSRSDLSKYAPGPCSTSYYNGSPAVVTSKVPVIRKSDSALQGTYTIAFRLCNDGSVY